MSFIDKATVMITAGDGGNGKVSFRHEKFIDRGGPDGGDGGNGGNVVFVASRNQNTLASFRYQRKLKAEDGQAGGKRRMHGKSGSDLLVEVPVGTIVINEQGLAIADLGVDGQRAIVAKGGQGGFGNAHFVSSVRQAPRVAEKGELGQEMQAELELKMIADVGLVGMPNAGKSTLLSVTSNATPEIANYPFTTIRPNLGVVTVDKENSLLMADIPGLIEGAAEGKGLGDEFLRHVERTAVLMHMIDAYQPNVADAYRVIQQELKAYKIDLSGKPQVVVLTKIEALDQDIIEDLLKQLKKVVPAGTPLFAISAQTHQGLKELLQFTNKLVLKERARVIELQEEGEAPAQGLPVLKLADDNLAWTVDQVGQNRFVITGRKIEKFAARTDFNDEHGVVRIRDIMKKMGIMHALIRKGINAGDTIQIATYGSFEY